MNLRCMAAVAAVGFAVLAGAAGTARASVWMEFSRVYNTWSTLRYTWQDDSTGQQRATQSWRAGSGYTTDACQSGGGVAADRLLRRPRPLGPLRRVRDQGPRLVPVRQALQRRLGHAPNRAVHPLGGDRRRRSVLSDELRRPVLLGRRLGLQVVRLY